MNNFRPLTLRWTAIPAANGIAIVFDSTRGPALMTPLVVTSAGSDGRVAYPPVSNYLIPGPIRGKYTGVLASGTADCTTDNVTAKTYTRREWDEDANDWELDTNNSWSGSQTVVAGTPWDFEWKPLGEWMIQFVAGGTPPTLLNVTLIIAPTSDF